MPADIHSLGAYRELKGESVPKLHRFDPAPAPPIPFVRRALNAVSDFATNFTSAKQRRDDLVSMFSQEAIDERQNKLLERWFEDTEGMCGAEKTKSMLQSKVGLASAIIEARNE